MNSAMTNLFNFQQEQIKMIMQQNMFDSMKCFQQTQELHEQHAQQQQQQIFEQQHVYSHSQSAISSQSVLYQDSHQINSTVSQSAVPNIAFSSSLITEKENEETVIKKFFE